MEKNHLDTMASSSSDMLQASMSPTSDKEHTPDTGLAAVAVMATDVPGIINIDQPTNCSSPVPDIDISINCITATFLQVETMSEDVPTPEQSMQNYRRLSLTSTSTLMCTPRVRWNACALALKPQHQRMFVLLPKQYSLALY